MPTRPCMYDAFISFKHSASRGGLTPDAKAAQAVYEALTAAGVRTFFSPECLKHHGQGKFSKTIEGALDSAKFLVLVASCREHVESRWVETEWDTFINDVRSGHKPDGDLVILNCGDLNPANLPLFLRRHSIFQEAEIASLVHVVRNACARPPSLSDVIKASLHCLDPKQKKDKIYVVTAHSPSGQGYVVKTHWGPREAKRLASMVKKTGVATDADVKRIVRSIADEKKRGTNGYTAKPWRSILTVDAMRFMAAELAVEMPARLPAKRKRSASNTGGRQSEASARRSGPSKPRLKRNANKGRRS